jgi:tetratricopeptide (TPR) repeat protein
MADSAVYCDLVGLAYSKLGQPLPAIESFQKALKLDPNNENYYLDLSQILEEYGARDAAIRLLSSGIAAHPTAARLHVGLALAYVFTGQLGEATVAAKKAILLEPLLETGYTTLALVYEDEKDWGSLLELSQRLLKLNSRNYLGWYYLGLAQMELQANSPQSLSEVTRSFRKAIELNPALSLADFQLGKLYLQQGDLRTAIAKLRRAIELKPDFVEAHFLLGKAYVKAGDRDRSREELAIHRKLLDALEARHQPHLEVQINGPN